MMTKTVWFPVILAIGSLGYIAQARSVQPDTTSSRELRRAASIVYKNAVDNYSRGYYWKAATDLIVILDFYPQFDRVDGVLYYLGECLLEMEMLKAAEKLFTYLLTNDIQSSFAARCVYGLEKVKYKAHRYKQALDYYRMLRVGFPDANIGQGPIYYAGQSYFFLSDYEKAIQILGKIHKSSDFYGYALYTIALSHIRRKEFEQAIESYRRLIALPTTSPIRKKLKDKANLTLGYLFFELKNYNQAIARLEDVSSDNKDKADALLGIGWAAIKLGKYEKAISALQELIQRFPESVHVPEANFLLGQSYLKLESYKGAIYYFSNILKMFPKTTTTVNTLPVVREKIEEQKKKIERLKLSLLIMESKFLDTVVFPKADVPNYVEKVAQKIQKRRKDLLKSIIHERRYCDRLLENLDQLVQRLRTRQIDWRSYAEYGVARALYLKSKKYH